ncbi:hypothetical protein [uncultured Muribaculum sp.]|uniref:hypothetical protein n=1 Tax=uncultured Muribaculum sp. TaxID=1918613 RepID=UPI002730175D|nr:hypothetical protein [uncultured Muribaculum sp.]
METENKKINEVYLLITELSGVGLLVNREVRIHHPNAGILSQLETMLQNPNRNILEMQDVFNSGVFSNETHNICLFNQYNEAYVKAAEFPEMLTLTEYKKRISDEEYREQIQFGKNAVNLRTEKVKEAMQSFLQSMKTDFFNAAKRYIAAEDYTNACNSVTTLEDLKIISTESIGWSTFEHRVGSDITFKIYTNFGYGRSAYFRMAMKYKGVDILPYSHVVTYPFANMQDLVRATRSYRAVRENWPLAMDFIVSTANLAQKDEEEFLKVWLKNEVEEMIAGLRTICEAPSTMIKRYEESTGRETNYLAVRNFTADDVQKFLACPSEMETSLKSTKMSGALMFLDNLQSIANVFGYVEEALIEMKELALSIIPEVELLEKKLIEQMHHLEKDLTVATNVLKGIERNLAPLQKRLNNIIENSDKKSITIEGIKRDFLIKNPKYVELKEALRNQQENVWNLEKKLRGRKNFYDTLTEQHETILTQTNRI